MNLAVLRTYRTQLEEALRTELAALTRSLDLIAEERVRLEACLDEQAQDLAAQARVGITGEDVAQRYALLAHITESLCRTEQLMAEAERQRQAKLMETAAALQERRKLDLLQERDDSRRRVAHTRQEQRQADESAGRRFLSDRRGASGT